MPCTDRPKAGSAPSEVWPPTNAHPSRRSTSKHPASICPEEGGIEPGECERVGHEGQGRGESGA